MEEELIVRAKEAGDAAAIHVLVGVGSGGKATPGFSPAFDDVD